MKLQTVYRRQFIGYIVIPKEPYHIEQKQHQLLIFSSFPVTF
ncbi:hypothetical protein bcere0022_23760 [Bacillus cereus Rock3-44]|nr:hypothetical protein bcere0022_23760 [Bacillus cereus Rock3-44]